MKKIQTKLMLLVIIGALSIAILSSIQSVITTESSNLATIEELLSELSGMSVQSAQNFISTYSKAVENAASSPTLLDKDLTAAEKQAFLQSTVDSYSLASAGITDTKGYDSYNRVNIADTAYFEAAIKGNTYISTPIVEGDKAAIMITTPIMENDTVTGVVYFQGNGLNLHKIINEINVGEKGEAYILDKEGTMIAYTDDQAVLDEENSIREAAENPNDLDLQTIAAIEQKMIAGETGMEEYHYESDDSNNIQYYAPIPGTDGWSIAITADKDEFMQAANKGIKSQIGISVVLCIIVVIFSFFISRSISRPIVACSKRLEALSKGDLKSDVPKVNGRDEVRTLADSTAHLVKNFQIIVEDMGRVLEGISNGDLTQEIISSHYPGDFQDLRQYLETIDERLNQIVGEIAEATSHVTSDAHQVATASGALSNGSIEQSSAVEELSATIRDMNEDATQTAQMAQNAKEAASGSAQQLQESNQQIEDLNRAMGEITASANEISHIIATIENIAFQTNILALNASVEAARAGESGRGFAVVAGEVRELAAKADQAAKATKELIQRSIDAVGSGSDIVQEVTHSVTNVAEVSQHAAVELTELASAVERQTGAIEQITEAIGQISNVVQTNSATAQESAAISDELSEQASTLNQLVGGFTLRRDW